MKNRRGEKNLGKIARQLRRERGMRGRKRRESFVRKEERKGVKKIDRLERSCVKSGERVSFGPEGEGRIYWAEERQCPLVPKEKDAVIGRERR